MPDVFSDTASAEASAVPDAVRVQILATEHWGLLATRSMTWNEIFTRTSMFLTTLSAAVVALALVAQATDFGENFRLFALVVLPTVLLLGIGTFIRLGDAMSEDTWTVIGMNRLRHAYLDLAPDLEQYFITGHYDDIASVMQTYGSNVLNRPSRILSATPVIVALLTEALVDRIAVYVSVGAIGALLAGMLLVGVIPYRQISSMQREYRPRFPRR
jgi:hypothetical protein